MKKNIGMFAACFCLLVLAACDEAPDVKSGANSSAVKTGSDTITSSQGQIDNTLASIEINIMFKYPDGQEVNFAQTVGLASCHSEALEHVVEKKLIMTEGWSYTCCTIENGSQCHRRLK
jgi:organic hydroperoxide reductase OsmC/OhrA